MKRAVTSSGNFILIVVAVWCTMGALISAFTFNLDLWSLIPAWVAAALLLAVLATFFKGKGIAVMTIPLVMLLVFRLSAILEGAKWAVFHITSQYNKWLSVPVVFPDASATQYELTLFFITIGIILAFFLSVSICLQRSAFHTIVFTAPFVFLTVVLIETTPDNIYLLGLLAVYLTLLISSSMHPYNFVKAGSSVFTALALSVVLLGAVYLLAPPSRYVRGGFADNFDIFIRDAAAKIGLILDRPGTGWPGLPGGEWRFNTELVSVSNAGTRMIMDQTLLEATSTQAGTFYLRGYSMERFNGSEWISDKGALPGSYEDYNGGRAASIAEGHSLLNLGGGSSEVNMAIRRRGDSSEIIYRPYYSYPGAGSQEEMYNVDFYYVEGSVQGLYDEIFEYHDSSTQQIRETSPDGLSVSYSIVFNQPMPVFIGEQAPSIYKQVDTSTAVGLRRIAFDAGIDPDADRAEIVEMVAEYISSAASYTLNPYITPEGEDFALYFLEHSKRGYCIHFATAATLMLRALDIPARFTSGFVVTIPQGSANRTVLVTDRHAHAWVEVFYDDVGWIPLEVTPAASGTGFGTGGAPFIGTTLPEAQPGIESSPPTGPTGEPPPGFSPSPTPGVGQGELDSASIGVLGVLLIVVLCAGAVASAAVAGPRVLRKRRAKLFSQPDTNAAVICAWRSACRINRRIGASLGAVEELALKARFSLHRISEEEREAVLEGIEQLVVELNRRENILGRFLLRYFLWTKRDI